MTTVRDLIGSSLEEKFLDFDITDVQEVLSNLKDIDAIDLPHAELLQVRSLYAADLLTSYIGKLVKTVAYLESRLSALKNKAALEYRADEGKTTVDMKKWASEADPDVQEFQIKLAEAKGTKAVIEKKYDILIKAHHYYKDVASSYNKTILGSNKGNSRNIPEGWE